MIIPLRFPCGPVMRLEIILDFPILPFFSLLNYTCYIMLRTGFSPGENLFTRPRNLIHVINDAIAKFYFLGEVPSKARPRLRRRPGPGPGTVINAQIPARNLSRLWWRNKNTPQGGLRKYEKFSYFIFYDLIWLDRFGLLRAYELSSACERSHVFGMTRRKKKSLTEQDEFPSLFPRRLFPGRYLLLHLTLFSDFFPFAICISPPSAQSGTAPSALFGLCKSGTPYGISWSVLCEIRTSETFPPGPCPNRTLHFRPPSTVLPGMKSLWHLKRAVALQTFFQRMSLGKRQSPPAPNIDGSAEERDGAFGF